MFSVPVCLFSLVLMCLQRFATTVKLQTLETSKTDDILYNPLLGNPATWHSFRRCLTQTIHPKDSRRSVTLLSAPAHSDDVGMWTSLIDCLFLFQLQYIIYHLSFVSIIDQHHHNLHKSVSHSCTNSHSNTNFVTEKGTGWSRSSSWPHGIQGILINGCHQGVLLPWEGLFCQKQYLGCFIGQRTSTWTPGSRVLQ